MLAVLFYDDSQWIVNAPNPFHFCTDGQILPAGSVIFGVLWIDDHGSLGEHIEAVFPNTPEQAQNYQRCIIAARICLLQCAIHERKR